MSTLLVVMLGGGLGAGLRYLVNTVVTVQPQQFPWATFCVNIVGAFVLGVASGIAARSEPARQWLLFIGTGVCGGFTTFSAFSNETLTLVNGGHYVLAGTYVAGSVVGGVVMCAMGYLVARHTSV